MEMFYVRPCDVDGVTGSGSDSDNVAVRLFRLQRKEIQPMERDVHDPRIVFEHPLDAVAVMDIPIDNQNPVTQNPSIHPHSGFRNFSRKKIKNLSPFNESIPQKKKIYSGLHPHSGIPEFFFFFK